jgi:hypothetical protein
MSDMLNEKFEEFVTEQKVIVEAGDPMPTVSANVIPGTGSEPSQVSDVQTSGSGGKDPMPSVQPGVAPGQSAPTDLGGTSTTPNEHDDDGEENPGAKAAAPVSQDGSVTSTAGKPGKDPMPSIGADVAYATSTGPAVTYPIKPSFESLDISADVNALLEGTELSEEFAEKAKTIFEAAVKAKISEEYDRLVEHFTAEFDKHFVAVKNEMAEEGLADTQKEKLAALAEGLEFVSEETFTKKVKTIKESYFKESIAAPAEVADETPVEGSEDMSPVMAQYLQALNRWNS